MLLPDSPWQIDIHHITQSEITQPPFFKQSTPSLELAGGIKFVLQLNRRLVAEYLEKTYTSEPRLKEMRHAGRSSQGLVGTVWAGILVRDFQYTVMLLLASINVSSPLCFPVGQIRFFQFGRESVGNGFLAKAIGRDEMRVPMKCNDVSNLKFFNFVQSMRDELLREPTSQFGRSFSFLTHSLSNRSASPLSALVWALAAIEALVGEKDRGSRKLVETRLLALLPELNGSNTIARFRKLYDLRGQVIHGSARVAVSFSDSSVSREVYPFDDTAFSQFLAMKMLHRYFEIGKKDVEFQMVVKR
ncbi:hypothetical protein GVY41_06860 [Frigidibacter albus]|uniref:Apea-like HEPN domain-containing protein n=1 Tax=Frigidibacter albus TaxID=1465486 RepID=A0A6L8VDT4_9RHOB|nr:hypothetical protein [Frigidibacter albus]MZQ88467.1 hypothetical protein [Frigidibacter albus]NBE30724.1 hypothetical protein [Frigidibacter albus]